MWFFGRKKFIEEVNKKEAQIQAIHEDTLKQIDESTGPTKKLNQYLSTNTGRIFLATPASKQQRSKK